MARPISPNQRWVTKDQAADYLGKSRRLIDYAVDLKLNNLGNESLHIKKVGNQILISISSLEETPHIMTRQKVTV
tara:strand:- start:446 stop:670 length:225 start_codon:yes stop_codon:yes gene_type:complete